MQLSELKNILEQKKGQKLEKENRLAELLNKHSLLNEELKNTTLAQEIIQIVAQQTQEKLAFHISNPVSLGLAAVFDNPYILDVDFRIKRGKTDCKLGFERNGYIVHPTKGGGGGAADIGAFGLRPALLTLQEKMKPPVRRILCLDEPFPHLKGIEANKRAMQMVKTISDELGIQILMVSDERIPIEEIEKGADRVFRTTIENGVSHVETINIS